MFYNKNNNSFTNLGEQKITLAKLMIYLSIGLFLIGLGLDYLSAPQIMDDILIVRLAVCSTLTLVIGLIKYQPNTFLKNYDSIISSSETINNDNSLLNCRINGFNKNKPDLIIIDRKLKINTSLDLFKLSKKRKIFIITSVLSGKKISLLRKKGVKFIKTTSLDTKKDFI